MLKETYQEIDSMDRQTKNSPLLLLMPILEALSSAISQMLHRVFGIILNKFEKDGVGVGVGVESDLAKMYNTTSFNS